MAIMPSSSSHIFALSAKLQSIKLLISFSLQLMMIISLFGQLGLWAPSWGEWDVFTSIKYVCTYRSVIEESLQGLSPLARYMAAPFACRHAPFRTLPWRRLPLAYHRTRNAFGWAAFYGRGTFWGTGRDPRRTSACRFATSAPKAIQGTFREHSGNIQGTFREYWTFRKRSRTDFQGTFRAHSENIQGTFREHSVNIQGT
jgi:hypothetical protein